VNGSRIGKDWSMGEGGLMKKKEKNEGGRGLQLVREAFAKA